MIPSTNEVRIETSTSCNAGCVFCPHPTEDFTRKREVMSLSDYVFYLDKCLSELGSQIQETTFSGFGEIFMDKGVEEKIAYASSCGLLVHVLSNGSMLTPSRADKLFEAGVKDVRISLHTSNPDSYGKIMNYKSSKFTFENTIRNLDYAINNKPSDVDIIITADIVEENRDDVDRLINDYGDKCSLEIWKPHNWVYGKEYRDKSSENVLDSCGRPFNGPIQIQIDGDVIMCCFDFDNKLVLGNFRHQTLEEIFSGPTFLKLYDHHEKGTCQESEFICANCDQLKDKGEVVLYNNRVSDKNKRTTLTSTALEKGELVNE
jgi:MoaA/NifB/PqqE/SkfB family radical SAM enzyme